MRIYDVLDRIFISRGQPNVAEPNRRQSSFLPALEKAEFLLHYAADMGTVVPTQVALAIARARVAYDKADRMLLTPEFEAEFWEAFSKLRSDVKFVSLEGIGSQAQSSARRMKSRYTKLGTFLLAIIIFISVVNISGNGLSLCVRGGKML